MKGVYWEEKGAELLEQRGLTKAEFARRMGVQRQNVNVLFRTNNLEIIARVAEVLDVPFALLVSYVDESDMQELPFPRIADELDFDHWDILPEDVPTGDTLEDRRGRQEIIKQFYSYWKRKNPDLCKYNIDLGEMIYVSHTPLVETAGRASLTYLSTLAVLQLDAILQNAKLIYADKTKPANKKQAKFEKMLGMNYSCPGIGDVRLVVGVRKCDKAKIQYCVTAMTPVLRNKKGSH